MYGCLPTCLPSRHWSEDDIGTHETGASMWVLRLNPGPLEERPTLNQSHLSSPTGTLNISLNNTGERKGTER